LSQCGETLTRRGKGQVCARPSGHGGQHYSPAVLTRRAERNRDRWKTPEGQVKLLLGAAAKRARRDGIPFSLSPSDVTIPANCPVCDRPLQAGDGKPCDSSPTLDKNVPALGYIRGNVLVICLDCNRRKREMSWLQLRNFAEAGQRALLDYSKGLTWIA
jgi:hypothetical protein